MTPLLQDVVSPHCPESLVRQIGPEPGTVLLRSALPGGAHARFSFVSARPFLRLECCGSHCELDDGRRSESVYGNPWTLQERLLGQFELLDELDLPFPLGGAFGFWGYDLKNFVEPKLPRRARRDLDLPDLF